MFWRVESGCCLGLIVPYLVIFYSRAQSFVGCVKKLPVLALVVCLFGFDCSIFGHFLFPSSIVCWLCEEITGPCLQLPQDPSHKLERHSKRSREHEHKTQIKTKTQPNANLSS